jgi:hypothetical protein
MTEPISPTTPEETPEAKLPWQTPEMQKAEINVDTACTAGSFTDGVTGSNTAC